MQGPVRMYDLTAEYTLLTTMHFVIPPVGVIPRLYFLLHRAQKALQYSEPGVQIQVPTPPTMVLARNRAWRNFRGWSRNYPLALTGGKNCPEQLYRVVIQNREYSALAHKSTCRLYYLYSGAQKTGITKIG